MQFAGGKSSSLHPPLLAQAVPIEAAARDCRGSRTIAKADFIVKQMVGWGEAGELLVNSRAASVGVFCLSDFSASGV
jgi:hypothetical protein